MLTQTVTITQNSTPNIIIGRRSTYETQQVIFDVSWLIQTYGEGTAELLIKRPKDASAYPVVATLDGNTLTWTVSETDTQDKGHGECEIYWYVNGGLAKSCICGITILRDIGDTTETAPDPYETWVDELARLGAETLANAQAAEQSATSAAQSATEADNSAAAALESEENALDSENAAKASEQAAAASEQGAEQSATAARQAATEAANSASTAESSASDAQGAADNASASADRAEQAAASIEGDTERAEAAAQTAQGAATSAQGSASVASTKATEAAGSAATAEQAANTATQKAADASASATAAAGSASSASASATAAGNAQTAAETAQGKAEDAQEAAETAAQSIEDSAAQIDTNTADILNLKSALDTKAGILRDTASGSVASFVPDSTVPNLLGLSVALEPIQDLHGYDSPWPAGGGKNLLDISKAQKGTGSNYHRAAGNKLLVGETTAVTISGENPVVITNTTNWRGAVFYSDPVKMGETYCLSYKIVGESNANVKRTIYEVDDDNNILVNIAHDASVTGDSETVRSHALTPTVDGTRFVFAVESAKPQSITITDLMLELGSTYTSFSPYSNICPISGWDAVSIWNKPTHDTTADPTVTIQLGQTVYGGTLDVTNGVLTVDRAMVVYDGSTDERWNIPASSKPWLVYGNVPSDMAMGNVDSLLVKSDAFKTSTRPWSTSTYGILNNYSNIVVGYPPCNGDVSVFKSYLTDHPLTVVYKLATPITIQLDPVTISTIAGQTNNVLADAGDVSVEFAADIKTYIDNKIAAAVAALS